MNSHGGAKAPLSDSANSRNECWLMIIGCDENSTEDMCPYYSNVAGSLEPFSSK